MVYNDNVFNEESFHKLIATKLSDISFREDGIVNACNKYIQFLEWENGGAHFRILLNEWMFDKILVAHEGDWTSEEGMLCHPPYKRYEEVQEKFGKGLVFRQKGFSTVNNRSLFLFDIDKTSDEHILAVPPTGEEIYFEIYGITKSGDLVLFVEREL